jgi:protein arginine kinase activator
MLCQKCHKNLATVRYAEVVSGKVTDLHLCADCLAKHQETASAGFELSGPVASARPRPAVARLEPSRTKSRRICKACGTSLAAAIETGRVGCSVCYTTFADELDALLEPLHGHAHHLGKRPHIDDMRVSLRATLQTKRALLRTAIQSERYEEAAELRDSIRKIETELGNPEGD